MALASKRRWPSIRIIACDPLPVAGEAATQGLVEAVVGSLAELPECDLIIIATPVQQVPGVLAQLSSAKVNALVTDTASTKRAVMAAAQSASARVASGELRRDPAEAASGREGGSASGLLFVGGHPVAGSEASGLAAARADLFDGRPWLLVSDSAGAADQARVSRADQAREIKEAMLASFVVGLGAKPEWTDAITHDRVMAHVSQAPHVVSTALKSDSPWPEAWEGILDTNADFIANALVAIAAKLPTSSSTLTDAPAVRDVFERAKALKSNQ